MYIVIILVELKDQLKGMKQEHSDKDIGKLQLHLYIQVKVMDVKVILKGKILLNLQIAFHSLNFFLQFYNLVCDSV